MATPEHTAPAGQESPPDELASLRALAGKYGTHLALGLGLVAVLVIGTRVYRGWRRGREATAQARLTAVRTVQELEALVNDYASTAAAPIALLTLGKTRYDLGHYDRAREAYERFLDRYAGHPMARSAELGRIHCYEALGDPGRAAGEFKAFAEAEPDHFLAPEARLGYARCLEQTGRLEDARIVYEDLVATRRGSRWAALASEALETMAMRREAAAAPPADAPAEDYVLPDLMLPAATD